MSFPPLRLAFYKGMGGKHGAIQFNLQRPHFYAEPNPRLKNYEGKFIPDAWRDQNPDLSYDNLISREGALFMEMTSAKGKNDYDWANKIVMALSITDMGKMLMVLEGTVEEIKIMHDPGAKTASQGKVQKYLQVSSPQGIKQGVIITTSVKEANGNVTRHTVPLSGDETKVLGVCIRNVIPIAVGWS